MLSPTEEHTISGLSNWCARNLRSLLDSSDSIGSGPLESLEDEHGRFRVWAANIGALQHEQALSSLDTRLRNAVRMRESVILALERLQNVIIRCQGIVTGAFPNRIASDTPGFSDQPTNELEQVMLNLHSSIRHLFSLSTLIRRMRPKGRLPEPQDFVPSENSPDIRHVEDKFPKAKGTPWLGKCLGNAVAQRRQIIQYRQTHRDRLATVIPREDVEAATSQTKISGTVATTYIQMLQGAANLSADRRSVFTSSTSFVSLYGNQLGRRIPDLPDMILENVQLDYGEPIECPYCRTIQLLSNRTEWRQVLGRFDYMRHVFSDLQPYVCTFEDCSEGLFASRQEWFNHEISFHRRNWVCIQCNSNTIFHSLADIKSHFELKHPRETSSKRREMILEAYRCPPEVIGPSGCPLCDEWDPPAVDSQNLDEFCRHLARHQQMLALEALPISIDGLEVQEAASSSSSDQDPEDPRPRMVTCTSCETVWCEEGHPTSPCPGCRVSTRTRAVFAGVDADRITYLGLPDGWEEMVASDSRVCYKEGVPFWPEGSRTNAKGSGEPSDTWSNVRQQEPVDNFKVPGSHEIASGHPTLELSTAPAYSYPQSNDGPKYGFETDKVASFPGQPPMEEQTPRATHTRRGVLPDTPPYGFQPLVCEFIGFGGCDACFDYDDEANWIAHIANDHLANTFPVVCVCWFCDHEPFRAASSSQADTKACYQIRMQHIAKHFHNGSGWEDMRPDFYFVDHIYQHGLITKEIFERACNYHEDLINNDDPAWVPRSYHPAD